ncbi:MAG: hypothetical protein ACM3H7_02820 [Acidobacteriaceae bacterium]
MGTGVGVAVLANTGRGVSEGSFRNTIGSDNNAVVEVGVSVRVKTDCVVANGILVFTGRAGMVGLSLLGKLQPPRASNKTIKYILAFTQRYALVNAFSMTRQYASYTFARLA